MKDDLPYPKPTAQVEPYIEALGLEDTLRFLEKFGGTEVRISENPQRNTEVAQAVGYAKAKSLGAIKHRLQRRTPTAKRWRAKVYHSLGLNNVQIARKLGVSDVSVRNYLSDTPRGDPDQLTLF